MNREERLDEIMRRASAIRRTREARRVAALGGSTAVLALGLVVLIGMMSRGGASVRPTALGAFLLGPEAGGYVIVALLAFAMGAAVTELGRRLRSKRAMNTMRDKEEQP